MAAAGVNRQPAGSLTSRRRLVLLPRMRQGGDPPRGHGHSRQPADTWKPGDTVRETGIYEVVHAADHRAAHEVVMLAQDQFPTCDTCNGQVRFRLLRTAPYIFQDEDFEDQR